MIPSVRISRAGHPWETVYTVAELASLIPDPDAECERLHSTTDRKRLRLLRDKLTEDAPYWGELDDNIVRTDWTPSRRWHHGDSAILSWVDSA